MFKVKTLEQIAECVQLPNLSIKTKELFKWRHSDVSFVYIEHIHYTDLLICELKAFNYLPNCRAESITCQMLLSSFDSLSWTSVQANPDDKILKIFIEGSVFGLIYFVCLCFCFFFVVKSLFLDGPVEVKSFQHFNVSTMQVSTLRYLFIF